MTKCIIKRIKPKYSSGSNGNVKVTYVIDCWEFLALKHALEAYAKVSPVGQDVLAYTINATADIK